MEGLRTLGGTPCLLRRCPTAAAGRGPPSESPSELRPESPLLEERSLQETDAAELSPSLRPPAERGSCGEEDPRPAGAFLSGSRVKSNA